jgi:hypothetical protein
MNIAKGYRTYITIGVMVLHQVLNRYGLVDLTGEDVSLIVDGILGVLAVYFRKQA